MSRPAPAPAAEEQASEYSGRSLLGDCHVSMPEGEVVVGYGRTDADAVLAALGEAERRLAPGGP